MADLQATLEFTVELTKFHNIDLFQRGYYHVRCSIKGGPRTTLQSEAKIVKPSEGSNNLSAYTCANVGVSRTFPIQYKREEVELRNVTLFKVYLLVDSQRIEESLQEASIELLFDLHFSGSEDVPGTPESMDFISSRSLKLNYNGPEGLHCHAPLLFDYFHLSAVSVTVHGSLLGLHQAMFGVPKPVRSGWLQRIAGPGSPTKQSAVPSLEAVLFGAAAKLPTSSDTVSRDSRSRAYQIYHSMCSVLLQTRCSLCRVFNELGKQLPQDQQLVLEYPDYMERLQIMCGSLQDVTNQEEGMEVVNTQLSQIAGELCLIWAQFVEVMVKCAYISNHLRFEYHTSRVQRFAEGFFTMDNPKRSAAKFQELSCQGYSYIGQAVRSSFYYMSLPRLLLECTEMDGDPETVPIIFEDRYLDSVDSEQALNLSIDEIAQSIRTLSKTPPMKQSDSPKTKISPNAADIVNPAWDKKHAKSKSKSKHSLRSTKSGKSSSSRKSRSRLRDRSQYEVTEAQPCISEILSSSTIDSQSPTDLRLVSSSSSLPSLSRVTALTGEDECCADTSKRDSYQKTRAFSTPENAYSSLSLQPSQGPYFRQPQKVCLEGSASSGIVGSADILVESETNGEVYANGYEESDEEVGEEPVIGAVASAEINLSFADSMTLNDGTGFTASGLEDIPSSQPISLENSQLRFLDTDSGMESDSVSSRKNSDTPVTTGTGESAIELKLQSSKVARRENEQTVPEIGTAESQDRVSVFSSSSTAEDTRRHHALCDCNSVHLVPSKVNTCIGCFSFMNPNSSSSSGNSNGGEACVVRPTLTHQPRPSAAVLSDAVSVESERESERESEPRNEKHLVQTLLQVSQASFAAAKADFKRKLRFTGKLYSDLPVKASTRPYFSLPEPPMEPEEQQLGLEVHLVVCVHGLDGNRADLRLLRTYIELGLPGERFDFLMSESNQGDTFADFETMTDRLVKEILMYIDVFRIRPKRMSFIGHSLGTIIIRSALTRPQLERYRSNMYTFLSLSGPHLGQLYNSSAIVNTGMWLMQKWKKSSSLLQLAFRDHSDIRQTFLYQLNKSNDLGIFKNVVLVGSLQDRYVPIHSARIELCRQAVKDNSLLGVVYNEMIHNLLQPIINNPESTLVRYDVSHTLSNSANTLIGRAAHIAFLDSELFIEKFMMVSALNYFK